MARLTLYYSVSNGGDGSAYPQWFETRELAEIDQELQSMFGEGWGESCTGEIVIEGSDDMRMIRPRITTINEVIERLDEIIESNSRYITDRHKRKARQFKEELRPAKIIRNITPDDPYGEEIVEERLKKYKDFK